MPPLGWTGIAAASARVAKDQSGGRQLVTKAQVRPTSMARDGQVAEARDSDRQPPGGSCLNGKECSVADAVVGFELSIHESARPREPCFPRGGGLSRARPRCSR